MVRTKDGLWVGCMHALHLRMCCGRWFGRDRLTMIWISKLMSSLMKAHIWHKVWYTATALPSWAGETCVAGLLIARMLALRLRGCINLAHCAALTGDQTDW